MNRVIIMRGIPGSGKTTEAGRWAALVPGSIIVATDHYMFVGGQPFDHNRLERCHEMCQADYKASLEARTPLVIVDNTNTKFSSIVPYVQMASQLGYAFTVLQLHVDPKDAFERGVHAVPIETLYLMGTHMWSERLPSSWDVWTKGTPWRPVRSRREDDEKPVPEILTKRVERASSNGPIHLSESGDVVGCRESELVSISRDPAWR